MVTPRREMMDFFSSAKPRFRPLSSMAMAVSMARFSQRSTSASL